MSIGNRQIGWSQEENLLWQISKQLDRMHSILCTGPCPTTTSTTTLPTTTTTTSTTAPILNRFEYSEGTAPSISAFETTIGFTLTDGVKTGDVITFSNSGYPILFRRFRFSTLISVDTLADTIGLDTFRESTNLVYFSAPIATFLGYFAFGSCVNTTFFNLSSITNLGGSVEDNNVFLGIIGNNITLKIPIALMTANAGAPDGDIQYLQANNTVTIITV
jgi:hypothetical protein